ncbi:hypothetical protein FDP41_011942 [Naegleria fowleri]|uniref:Protein TEX261 n=1 Tax=Naegleria fowleri TaxID=5763 RepID=A0A6A5C4Q2_NAEFO|nr:uncharacterized protein FDP41_011942 [Naegleria fowleri]KAF0982081.1 hypothetical protein FDP41_011942 [Naegleria fowleri]
MIAFIVISHISLYVGIMFLILCVATGLYYLAELAEENSVMTRKVISYMIYLVVMVHLILWIFDELYFWCISIGILSHIAYYQLLSSFPFVRVKSASCILSIVGFIVSHVGWYYYFIDFNTPIYEFSELLGFFFICVWFTPLALFVSLSIGDMQLPGLGMEGSDRGNKDILKKKNNVVQWIMSQLNRFRRSSSSDTMLPHHSNY